MRILLLAALALSLTGCAKAPDSDSSTGFIGAWRQFLELDTAAPTSATIIDPEPTKARAMTAAAAAKISSLATDLAQVTESMRAVYGEANTINSGFPTAEDSYRKIPRQFAEQVIRIRENKRQADAATIHRRLTELTGQALNLLDRQHTRVSTLQSNFQQRLEGITKRTSELEQSCAKVKAQPTPRPEEASACSEFQDGSTMLKTKADIVVAGFASLEGVYKEVRQTQSGLNAEILAGK